MRDHGWFLFFSGLIQKKAYHVFQTIFQSEGCQQKSKKKLCCHALKTFTSKKTSSILSDRLRECFKKECVTKWMPVKKNSCNKQKSRYLKNVKSGVPPRV